MISEKVTKKDHEIFLHTGSQQTQKSNMTAGGHLGPHEVDLSDRIQPYRVGSLCPQSLHHLYKATLSVPLLSWCPHA